LLIKCSNIFFKTLNSETELYHQAMRNRNFSSASSHLQIFWMENFTPIKRIKIRWSLFTDGDDEWLDKVNCGSFFTEEDFQFLSDIHINSFPLDFCWHWSSWSIIYFCTKIYRYQVCCNLRTNGHKSSVGMLLMMDCWCPFIEDNVQVGGLSNKQKSFHFFFFFSTIKIFQDVVDMKTCWGLTTRIEHCPRLISHVLLLKFLNKLTFYLEFFDCHFIRKANIKIENHKNLEQQRRLFVCR
jgi:hypothetical protein